MKGQAQDTLIQDVSTGGNFVLTPPSPWGHLTVETFLIVTVGGEYATGM